MNRFTLPALEAGRNLDCAARILLVTGTAVMSALLAFAVVLSRAAH